MAGWVGAHALKNHDFPMVLLGVMGRWDGVCVGGGMGWMEMCPAPVLTWPEAPGSETLWLTCQGVAGSPALDSGVTGHH